MKKTTITLLSVISMGVVTLTEAQTTNTQLRLAWDQPYIEYVSKPWPDGVGVKLYRQTDCTGPYTVQATVSDANTMTITDGNVVRGVRYCYYVTAYTPLDESLPSNIVDVTVPTELGVPHSLRLDAIITIKLQ